MGQAVTGERTRCFLRANIVFNDGLSSIECTIRNMSLSGARLEVDGSIAIPQMFDLEIPSQDVTHRVSVQWRDVDAVGVELMDDEQDLHDSPLAAENRVLREQLEMLTRQLREQMHA